MLSTDYTGPFEEPQGSEGGAEITTTAVDAGQPATEEDAFSVTSTLGGDGSQPLEAEVDVASMDSAIDALLADTPLTRDDVDLLVRTGTLLVAVVALYLSMEANR